MKHFKIISILTVSFLIVESAFAIPIYYDGRKTVTTAGTAETISSADLPFKTATICAESDNTGVIAIGNDPIAALATREGVFLFASDCWTADGRDNINGNLNQIKIDASVSTDGVTYTYSQIR